MESISVIEAAHIMHKDPQFVRAGLQKGQLPFGSAVRVSNQRYSYYISPQKFAEYIGISYQELEEQLNERHF